MELINLVFSGKMQKKLAAQKEFVEELKSGEAYLETVVKKHLEHRIDTTVKSESFVSYADEQGILYTFSKIGNGGILKYL